MSRAPKNFFQNSIGLLDALSMCVGQTDRSVCTLSVEYPMREWIMMLTPVAAIMYFVVYPDQLAVVGDWFARLAH